MAHRHPPNTDFLRARAVGCTGIVAQLRPWNESAIAPGFLPKLYRALTTEEAVCRRPTFLLAAYQIPLGQCRRSPLELSLCSAVSLSRLLWCTSIRLYWHHGPLRCGLLLQASACHLHNNNVVHAALQTSHNVAKGEYSHDINDPQNINNDCTV